MLSSQKLRPLQSLIWSSWYTHGTQKVLNTWSTLWALRQVVLVWQILVFILSIRVLVHNSLAKTIAAQMTLVILVLLREITDYSVYFPNTTISCCPLLFVDLSAINHQKSCTIITLRQLPFTFTSGLCKCPFSFSIYLHLAQQLNCVKSTGFVYFAVSTLVLNTQPMEESSKMIICTRVT